MCDQLTSMLHTKSTFTIGPSAAFFYLITPCFKDGSMKSGETTIFNPFSNTMSSICLWAATHRVISEDYTNRKMFKSFVEENKM